MATIVDDHVMVCDDCLMIIGNDDATGLDHFLDEESAPPASGRCVTPSPQRSATGTPSSSAIASKTKRSRRHPAAAATPTWRALGTTAC
ncbi:hypothetical protein [Billgrantia gudaonensis]|uniref:hypothetical protein n=1 Tax=Billgrantia gudaonensis TaxID=376427 RepID=UPI000B7C6FF1|nr:hypothetical protein [Halomonas gudaonensis]